MSKKGTTSTMMKRRGFLLSLGLGGVAAAGALGGKLSTKVADDSSELDKPLAEKGYRLSAHVQNYYRSARL